MTSPPPDNRLLGAPDNRLLWAPDKVALITGAAGGIGAAAVTAFAAAGAQIAAVDMAAVDKGDNARIKGFRCDLTSEAQVKQVVASVLDEFGGVDYLIHAAGVVGKGPLQDVTLADWCHVMDANLTSAFLLTRELADSLQQASGAVVFMSSINGVHGGTPMSGPAYAAAKAGLINLARYLAKEWAPSGVRVNAITCGSVDTPMLNRLNQQQLDALVAQIPLQRSAQPAEIAAAIAYLCSDHAGFITGTNLNISGGRVM